MPNRSKDCSLCTFTFADARRCRMARRKGHPYLCDFHARKEEQALAGQQAAKDIAYHVSGAFLSACDLGSALGRLFAAVAQGHIKPKTASTLAYLGQTLVQNLHLAQDEYINACGTNAWREAIRHHHELSEDYICPPESDTAESPDPESSGSESLDTPRSESPEFPASAASQSADAMRDPEADPAESLVSESNY